MGDAMEGGDSFRLAVRINEFVLDQYRGIREDKGGGFPEGELLGQLIPTPGVGRENPHPTVALLLEKGCDEVALRGGITGSEDFRNLLGPGHGLPSGQGQAPPLLFRRTLVHWDGLYQAP